ncbi:MAG: uroporphyrinogen decarboxylase family protein [Victivallaceae bacterium]
MNSREIIHANLEHCNPVRPGLTFNNGRINDMCWGGPDNPKGWTKKRWVEGQYEYYDDIWGNIWVRMTDGCAAGEVFKPAIEEWTQLKDFQIPQYDFEETVNSMRQGFAKGGDKFKLAGMPGWVFASSRYLRKMEIYLIDMLLYPEELKQLHEKVAGVFELLIRAAGEAGGEGIFFCEDMGTQNGLLFSPALWQEYFGDLYRRLFGLAHECGMKVFMHSCGQNRQILEPLLQAGVDCFQFDQPAIYDMAELAQLLKKYQAALWSPIDIQKIMPTGDRQIIEKGVEDMFKHFEGGLIFKNYGDLKGIGVKNEWDNWAYQAICKHIKIDGY